MAGEGGRQSFGAFLKKRAPIYIGLTGLFLIFVVPGLLEGSLENSLPSDLGAEEQRVVGALLGYNGPEGEGLTMLEAISIRIEEEYPGEKIYDRDDTVIDIEVGSGSDGVYPVTFHLETYRDTIEYIWNVNPDTGVVTAENDGAGNLLNFVDYYD